MTRKIQLFKKITVCMLLAFLITAISYGQQYRATKLVHPDGRFYASGMNNLGQVCGSVLVDEINFINHAVRYEQDGTFTTLTLGENGNSATARNMNEHGHVIGTINTTDFTSRVGIWETDSTFRELSQPEGFISIFPKDVNNRGEAVGHTLTTDPKAYYWDTAGNFHELPQRGFGAEAIALNDSSQIGGRIFDDKGNSIPALWQPDNGPGNGDQGFTLVELDEPSPNARINDISNAIFPVTTNDSDLKSATSDITYEMRLAGFRMLQDLDYNTATIFTESADLILPDDGEFESEIYSIGPDLTFYGYRSNQFSGFDGVGWRNDIKSSNFNRLRFNDLSDGAIAGKAEYGNYSGSFIADAQIDPYIWYANDRVAVSSILGSDNWELGNSNLSAPDFNIPHGLDFKKFIWGVDINGNYQDVEFKALNDNGIHWLIGWNGLNGVSENYGAKGWLDIHGLTNLSNVKSGPKLDLRITGNGDFSRGTWNLGGNTATFFADEGDTNEYKFGGAEWLYNGNLSVHGAGRHKFLTDVKENSFPSTTFGDGFDWTKVDFLNSLTEEGGRTLMIKNLSIRGATVEFRGYDAVEIDSITIAEGEVTELDEGQVLIKYLLAFFGGSLTLNDLIGDSNSTVEIGEEAQFQFDHFKFNGLTFKNSGMGKFNKLEFGNTKITQKYINSNPDDVEIQEFITETQRLVMKGRVKTNILTLNSGNIVGADSGSMMDVTGLDSETFLPGSNRPVSGSVTSNNNKTHLEIPLSRNISGFANLVPNVENKANYFPVGNNDQSYHMILQAVPGGSRDNLNVGVEVVDLGEEKLKLPGKFEVNPDFNYQYIEDNGWRVTYKIPVDFKSLGAADSFKMNIRIPAFNLENVTDLDQYRLLLYDCDGNLLGQAGDFMPPSSEPQSSVLYTGMIEGVFNITHTNVPLDTCQYIVLASRVATSTGEPSVHRGFELNQNQPNPFSLHTSIGYTLAVPAQVNLSVYNMLGQQVRSLVLDKQEQGDYTVEWDGTDDSGRVLSGGIYFYRMVIKKRGIGLNDVVLSRKMVLE